MHHAIVTKEVAVMVHFKVAFLPLCRGWKRIEIKIMTEETDLFKEFVKCKIFVEGSFKHA